MCKLDSDWIVVGVSGGSDSMALLHQMKQCHKQVVAVHINYNARKTSKRDEVCVQKWCKEQKIPLVIEQAFYQKEYGNFEAWARNFRYDCFQKVAKTYRAQEIFIGHHLEDHLETYLMQKNRKILPTVYGLSSHRKLNEFIIVRPLLHQSKEQLRQYCRENEVPWIEDETNHDLTYERNKIRKKIVFELSSKEKVRLVQEIQKRNEELSLKRNQWESFLKNWDFQLEKLLQEEEKENILEYWLFNHLHVHLSQKYIQEILNQFLTTSVFFLEGKNQQRWILQNWQGKLTLEKEPISFSFPILNEEEWKNLETKTGGEWYRKEQGMEKEHVILEPQDYPVIFRSPQPGDTILLSFGHKKLNRYFIDRRVSPLDRKKTIVIENREKQILFVSNIGKAFFQNKEGKSIWIQKKKIAH